MADESKPTGSQEKCPYCGATAEAGYLIASEGGTLFFRKGEPGFWKDFFHRGYSCRVLLLLAAFRFPA
jgi:hypothetical protein